MACDTLDINGQTFAAEVAIEGFRKGNSLFGEGPWREVVYIVDGEITDAFIDALLGTITFVGLGGPITFPNPHRYPGNTRLCALDAWADPIGVVPDEIKLARGKWDEVHVRYGVPKVDLDGDDTTMAFGGQGERFTSDSTRTYSAEYTVPSGVFTDSTGTPYDKTRTVKIPHTEYVRSKLYVPYFYDELIKARVGKVNNAVFFGHDVGTLLFEGADDAPEFNEPSGKRVRGVVMRFTWRPYDWNAEIMPDAPYRWDILESDDGGSPVYTHEYADFMPLVNPL